MAAVFVIMLDPGQDIVPPPIVVEFEELVLKLDLRTMLPAEWVKFKSIIAQATLEAGDSERGQLAYDKSLAQWRMCRAYDHD